MSENTSGDYLQQDIENKFSGVLKKRRCHRYVPVEPDEQLREFLRDRYRHASIKGSPPSGPFCCCGLQLNEHKKDVIDAVPSDVIASDRRIAESLRYKHSNVSKLPEHASRSQSPQQTLPPPACEWTVLKDTVEETTDVNFELPIAKDQNHGETLKVEDTTGHTTSSTSNLENLASSQKCLRVSHTQPIKDVLDVMREKWQLLGARDPPAGSGEAMGVSVGKPRAPRFIVSIVGSAPINEIRPRFRVQYYQTLLRLIHFVEQTHGWLVVSGAGELRNLTEVCRNMKRPLGCVTIGVLPWGALNDAEAQRLAGKETERADENGVSIAPFCTHMLLVDDGRHRHFAGDLDFLAALERELVHLGAEGQRVPLCHVVVGGSTGSLHYLHNAVNDSFPVLVLKGSGQLADILASSFEIAEQGGMDEEDEEWRHRMEEKLLLTAEQHGNANEDQADEGDAPSTSVITTIDPVTGRTVKITEHVSRVLPGEYIPIGIVSSMQKNLQGGMEHAPASNVTYRRLDKDGRVLEERVSPFQSSLLQSFQKGKLKKGKLRPQSRKPSKIRYSDDEESLSEDEDAMPTESRNTQHLKYSFSERSRTFILEQIRQRVGRSSGSSLEDERRVLHSFLNIEEIVRHRHMLLVLQLDDLSDDLIPKKVTKMLVLPFRNHLLPYPEGNKIFSPILLQACIHDFPDVVRTIFRSGVIIPNQFLTFQMLVDLFKCRIGVYRRIYKREQKEIERRRQAILTRYVRRKQSARPPNTTEGPESTTAPILSATGDVQLGIIHEQSVMEDRAFNVSSDANIDYANSDLADELLEFEAEVIDSIIGKLTVSNLYSISDLYKEMKAIQHRKSVTSESNKHKREPPGDYIPHSIHYLLLWSLYMSRCEIAQIIWESTSDPLSSSLIASIILNEMTEQVSSRERAIFDKGSDDFDKLALDILDQCFEHDSAMTQTMIRRTLDERYQMQSCIQLADAAESRKILSHKCCVIVVDEIWNGVISPEASIFWYFLAIICPFFVRRVCHLDKVDEIRAHVRELMEPKKTESSVKRSESEPKEARGAQIELEPVGSAAGQAHVQLSISQASPETPLLKDQGTVENPILTTSKSETKAVKPEAKMHHRKKAKEGELVERPSKVHLSVLGSIRVWIRCVAQFYCSPSVIFTVNLFAYLIFLSLLSYALVFGTRSEWTNIDFIVLVIVSSMLIEEVHQMLGEAQEYGLRASLKQYISSIWNQIDCLSLLLFFIGSPLYNIPKDSFPFENKDVKDAIFEIGRVCLVFSLLLFIIRLLNIFTVRKLYGPKLLMLGRMIKDLVVVWTLLGVFLLAFAISSQALLYIEASLPNMFTIGAMLTRSYWPMFGQYNFPEWQNKQNNITGPNDTVQTFNVSPVAPYLLPFMMAGYIICTVLILFNMVIAMFNNTFQKIEAEAEEYWSLLRFRMAVEYLRRPPLPPPFILIWHFILIIRFLIRLCGFRCFNDYCRYFMSSGRFKVSVTPKEEENLLRLMRTVVTEYIEKRERSQQNEMQNKLSTISEKMNSIVDDVSTMSVAAESHSYLLKHWSESPNHTGTPSRLGPTSGTPESTSLLQTENIKRSVLEIEKTNKAMMRMMEEMQRSLAQQQTKIDSLSGSRHPHT